MSSSLHEKYYQNRYPIAALAIGAVGIGPSLLMGVPFSEFPVVLGVATIAYGVGMLMVGFVMGIQLKNPMCSDSTYNRFCLFFFYSGLALCGMMLMTGLPNLAEIFPFATGEADGPYRPSTYLASLAVLPGIPAGAVWMKSKSRAAA